VTLTLNPSVDKSCSTESIQPDNKLSCRDVRYEPGGGGLNVARAIHRLGGRAIAVHTSGGRDGHHLATLLGDADISQQLIEIDANTRENLMVFERSTNQQYRFGMPGAELTETEQQSVLQHLRAYKDCDWLIASGSLPPSVPTDFYAQVASVADEIGAKYVVDTRGQPLRDAVERGAYLIKPNHRELAALSDKPVESEEDQEQVAHSLIDAGKCSVVVLSLGAAGVLAVTADLKERVRSPSVPIRSKVGAGDSMVAGLVYALHRGLSIRDAVRFGTAAGAAAVMTPGSELCKQQDVQRLYEQME
jgi:6-phosphofructokinase 2